MRRVPAAPDQWNSSEEGQEDNLLQRGEQAVAVRVVEDQHQKDRYTGWIGHPSVLSNSSVSIKQVSGQRVVYDLSNPLCTLRMELDDWDLGGQTHTLRAVLLFSSLLICPPSLLIEWTLPKPVPLPSYLS